MTKDEALRMALDALESNRRTHHYCEDTWYSCPKHEDGCANDSESDECNCGADKANAGIDKAITAIKEALAQPEQELTAKLQRLLREDGYLTNGQAWDLAEKIAPFCAHSKEWQDLTDEEMRELEKQFEAERVRTSDEEYLIIYPSAYWEWQRAIEAKLKEKNT